MTDSVKVLTPAVRPLPPFPKLASLSLGVSILLCIPLSPIGPLPVIIGFGIATCVALMSAWTLGAWMEESFYAHFIGSSPLKRTLVAIAVPAAALLLSVPTSLVGVPLEALGDDGVLAAALLTGMWWLGLSGIGTLIVVLLDVTASSLAREFRSRIILAIMGLVAAVSALVALVISAGDRLAEIALATGLRSATWRVNVDGQTSNTGVDMLIGPEEARLLQVLLWCVAALFSLPIILSACGKLADAIMERLHPLTRGFSAIADGDLEVQIEEAGSDDFVALSKGFNSMVHSLALGRKMERAFGLYVSKHVLQRIRARHGEAALPAVQKDATVFFADIRSFTSMSERLEPAQVLGILNRYFERVVSVIDAHEGFLNKFVGDAVVVVFNGPLDQPDHAERAARCAINIQREVEMMNARGEFREVGGLKVGIGVATGPVVAGNLGSSKQMEYTVIGDTVNLAARLTSRAPGGEVWVNEPNAVALPRAFKLETLTPMAVKGKEKLVTPYRLWPVGTSPDDLRTTAVDLPALPRTLGGTMTLEKRVLGKTGMAITKVGLGTWAIGGGGWSYGWGPQQDTDSIAAIRHAIGLGVNWIDTAAIYGLGHAEEVIARALADIPKGERPLVFTKCGLIGNHKRPFDEPVRELRPKSIRKECAASLKRLGVETIDLYQIHWPASPSIPIEDVWAELLRLAEEGKIRALGVSNFDVNLLERCEKVRHVDSLQPPFSMIRRNAAADLLPWCAAHETGAIIYSPMQAGLLTDRFRADRVATMTDDDWRRRSSNFKPPRVSCNLALRDALKPVASRHGTTVATIAVAWTLAFKGVTAAVVGARTPAQVDGWVGAANLSLTDADLDEIARAIAETKAGDGPTRP